MTMKIRKRIVIILISICNFLLPDSLLPEEVKEDPGCTADIVFLNDFKDATYLKLQEFLLAYESCQVDCIAAVIKYKRTDEQKADKQGSFVDFVSDWGDNEASACVGVIRRLLSQTEFEAYGDPEEDD